MPKERLDKILASQGIGSRKEVREMVKKGRVTLNGTVVLHPEEKVESIEDKLEVDGQKITIKRHIYLMMNKPQGVISASNDPRVPTVVDLVPENLRRRGLFPAGRLDKDTEGLLIITDDGEFAHRMLSPKKRVYKLYEATVRGEVGEQEIARFQQGVRFQDGTLCLPAELKVLKRGQFTQTQVRICEGKFHQIKKMFLAVGCEVLQLKRIKIGNLTIDNTLKAGECREISEKELKMIFE